MGNSLTSRSQSNDHDFVGHIPGLSSLPYRQAQDPIYNSVSDTELEQTLHNVKAALFALIDNNTDVVEMKDTPTDLGTVTQITLIKPTLIIVKSETGEYHLFTARYIHIDNESNGFVRSISFLDSLTDDNTSMDIISEKAYDDGVSTVTTVQVMYGNSRVPQHDAIGDVSEYWIIPKAGRIAGCLARGM